MPFIQAQDRQRGALFRKRRREGGGSSALFSFAAGDSVAAKSGAFTRAGTRTYYDINGVRQTAGSGQCIGDGSVKHYLSAVPHILLQPARTNSALWAEDLTNPAWTKLGVTPTTVGGSVTDMMGGTNIKCGQIGGNGVFTDQGFVNAAAYVWTAATPQGFAFDVKPGNKNNFFVLTTDGVATTATSWGNASTGATGTTAGTHTLKFWGVQSNGWYRFEFRLSTSGVTVVLGKTLRFSFCDADNSTTLTGDGVTVNGSFNAVHHEQDKGWVSSYIATTNVAVTAVADSLTIPHNSVPKSRTLYVKVTYIGPGGAAIVGSSAVAFRISAIGAGTYQWLLDGGAILSCRVANNGSSGTIDAGHSAPTIGAVVELRGSGDTASPPNAIASASVNGDAEATGAPTAVGLAYQVAYDDPNYLLSYCATNDTCQATQVFKDIAGNVALPVCRVA